MSVELQKEYQYFQSHLNDFIKDHHLNEFVLIRGEEVIDFFRSYEQALREGLKRFGNVPFFIKAVKKEEEVHYFHQGLS